MKTIPVTCAIIRFNDKILAVQRSKKMKLPLKWEFPGGKLENGESEIECVKREISEELNINIEVIKKLTTITHQYPGFRIELIPFTANYISGKLELKEHSNFVLANKDELIKLDWAEADLPVLKEFIEL